MQITERVLRHQRAAIQKPHPPIASVARIGSPEKSESNSGVRRKAHHADLHDQGNGRSVLRLLLCQKARVEIALNVDIRAEAVLPSDIAPPFLRFYRHR